MIARVLAAALILAASAALAEDAPPPPSLADPALHPLTGQVWLVAEERAITPAELLARLAESPVVLLGETHDNPDHHRLQGWISQHLAAQGRLGGVAFEMIDRDQQPVLSQLRPTPTSGWAEPLAWQRRGWPDWNAYRPIADAALAANAPILAANLARAQVAAIMQGTLAEVEALRLGLRDEWPQPLADSLSRAIADGHCRMLPADAIAPMALAQRGRDAEMAEVLRTAAAKAEGRAVVLIAGAGHTRTDRAVPWHLARRAPALRAFALAFVEVDGKLVTPQAYAAAHDASRLPFDAVWFTPRHPREDPCKAFAAHMKKRKP